MHSNQENKIGNQRITMLLHSIKQDAVANTIPRFNKLLSQTSNRCFRFPGMWFNLLWNSELLFQGYIFNFLNFLNSKSSPSLSFFVLFLSSKISSYFESFPKNIQKAICTLDWLFNLLLNFCTLVSNRKLPRQKNKK